MAIIQNVSRRTWTRYNVRADVSGADDIEIPGRNSHTGVTYCEILRPDSIEVSYDRTGITRGWCAPIVHIYGHRVINGQLSRLPLSTQFGMPSSMAPEWVTTFVNDNPPPEV